MIVRSDYEQQKILSEIMESEKQRYKFVKNKAMIPSMLLSSRDRFVSHRLQTVYTNEMTFSHANYSFFFRLFLLLSI